VSTQERLNFLIGQDVANQATGRAGIPATFRENGSADRLRRERTPSRSPRDRDADLAAGQRHGSERRLAEASGVDADRPVKLIFDGAA
jgi:hypothetical protein